MTESVTRINKQLESFFGKADDGRANWRVVWSDDQFEKRFGRFEDRTPEGLLIRVAEEVRTVPKYRQWIQSRWVLERLTPVPEAQKAELIDVKLSYEPIYVCQTQFGDPLPPRIDAFKFMIENLLDNMNQSPKLKYKDPDSNPEEARANESARIDKLQKELFGNETDIGDALAHKEGVGFTTSKIISGQKEES